MGAIHTRTNDLVEMAKAAGLEVLHHYQKANRVAVDVQAKNGVKRTFSLSMGSRSDVKGDLNESAAIKRFARANTPADEPALAPEPAPAVAPVIEPAPMKPAVTSKPKRTILKVTTTKPAAPTAAAPVASALEHLTPAEFYRLCLWISATDLTTMPSLEALALAASQHIGQTVSEPVMREVLQATETAEPEHWTALPDPHVIVARELAAFMESLGAKPSATFARFMEALA